MLLKHWQSSPVGANDRVPLNQRQLADRKLNFDSQSSTRGDEFNQQLKPRFNFTLDTESIWLLFFFFPIWQVCKCVGWLDRECVSVWMNVCVCVILSKMSFIIFEGLFDLVGGSVTTVQDKSIWTALSVSHLFFCFILFLSLFFFWFFVWLFSMLSLDAKGVLPFWGRPSTPVLIDCVSFQLQKSDLFQ